MIPFRGRILKLLGDMIVEWFQIIYKPGPKVVTDETTIPFRGRTYFRQYNHGQRHKNSFELFKLSYVNRYIWNIEVHSGKVDISKSTCYRLHLLDWRCLCLTWGWHCIVTIITHHSYLQSAYCHEIRISVAFIMQRASRWGYKSKDNKRRNGLNAKW